MTIDDNQPDEKNEGAAPVGVQGTGEPVPVAGTGPAPPVEQGHATPPVTDAAAAVPNSPMPSTDVPSPSTEPRPRRRGFAAMDRERVKAIASKGGRAAHA